MNHFFQAILAINCLIPVSLPAQQGTDSILWRTYTTQRTLKPPHIDGVLDDECWKEGEWHGNFIQQQPYQGKPGSYPSEIKILYNTNYLFVAIRCYDEEPDKIRDIFSRRDQFAGDMTGIALDSYGDDKTAFEFNLSAAGQKVDLKHKGDFEFDIDWNAVWEGKTALEDSAWTAEMRIPFSQLRYSDRKEQEWGMHIWRWIDRKSEESQWKLIPVNAPAMVFLFGDLKGISDIRSSRQVEFLPHVLTRYAPVPASELNPYGKTRKLFADGGFDAKVALSSNFTLDATFNPDFGQVEADPSVLNLTAYETFYNEKRPFFLESREIFEYTVDDNMLYYSRRLGHAPGFVPEIGDAHYLRTPQNSTILGALKITGKTPGGLSVGITESMVSKEYATLYRPDRDPTDTLVNPYTNYLIARVLQEKNGGNTILGGMITGTNQIGMDSRISSLLHHSAYTGGLDFEQNFAGKTYYIDGRMLFSHLEGSESSMRILQESGVHQFQRPGADYLSQRYDTTLTSLSGTGGYIAGGKKGGKWRYYEKLGWLSPGLDMNDAGYLRQADILFQYTSLQYRENEPGKYLRNYTASVYQSASSSFGGELTGSAAGIGIENGFLNLWGLSLNWDTEFSTLDTRELRGGPALRVNGKNSWSVHLNSNQSKNLNFNTCYHFSKTMHEDSRYHFTHLQLNWYPISRILLSSYAGFTLNQDKYQYIQTLSGLQEPRYLMGSLDQKTLELTFRAEFFLTPELSLQFYGSPYFSIGRYSEFFYVDQADARDEQDRFHAFSNEELGGLTPGNAYLVTESQSDMTYSFQNPDFMFSQLRTNLVFRWEYKLGSVFYFVWSLNRTVDERIYMPTLTENMNYLSQIRGGNIFLLKLNYWFSI